MDHKKLVKTLSDFDREDIGERVNEIPHDLKHVKNILVTGGAGFMLCILKKSTIGE